MEITTIDTVQMKMTGEKGDYILLIPVGSQLEETVQKVSSFVSILAKSHQLWQEEKSKEDSEEKIKVKIKD